MADKKHLLHHLSLDNLEGVSGGVLSDSFKAELRGQYAACKAEGLTKKDLLDYYAEPGGVCPVGVTTEDLVNYLNEVWDEL